MAWGEVGAAKPRPVGAPKIMCTGNGTEGSNPSVSAELNERAPRGERAPRVYRQGAKSAEVRQGIFVGADRTTARSGDPAPGRALAMHRAATLARILRRGVELRAGRQQAVATRAHLPVRVGRQGLRVERPTWNDVPRRPIGMREARGVETLKPRGRHAAEHLGRGETAWLDAATRDRATSRRAR